MRPHLLALVLFAPACYAKPDLPSREACALDDSCPSTDGSSEDGSSDGAGESPPDDSTDPAGSATSPTTDPTTDPSSDPSGDPTGGSADDESSSGAASESSDEDSSSTGEPADDNLYAPCTSDDMCTTGVCVRGFCTQECWSAKNGDTPCPAAPDGAAGVDIVCGTIPENNGFDHFCESCIDCAQYCIAVCDEDSACPNDGYCMNTGCIGADLHCGAYEYEGSDVSCSDDFDNDADDYVDCDDFDCSSASWVTVCGPGENTDAACMDGIDNDDDGYLDCGDYDCSANAGVTVCG